MKKTILSLNFYIFLALPFVKAGVFDYCISVTPGVNGGTISISLVNNSGAAINVSGGTVDVTPSNGAVTITGGTTKGFVSAFSIPSGGSATVINTSYTVPAATPGTSTFSLSNGSFEEGLLGPVTAFTNAGCSTSNAIILPVTLLNFQAQPQGKTNFISWQTASEKENEGFQIQRSAEGKTFKNIGFVKGQGTTNEKQSYSFVDEGPLSISYYRLLQKDFDGKESYSKVVSVVSDSKTHVKIYPNPVADVLNVQINTEKELNTALELYDSAGKMVHTENFNTQKGDNQMSFSTKQLARGFYTLKIKQGDEVVVEKVMIQ
jgi:hypothetical protein